MSSLPNQANPMPMVNMPPQFIANTAPVREPVGDIEFDFEWVFDAHTIKQIQQFRASVFTEAYGVYFDNNIDKDHYDKYSLHALVRNSKTGEIAAYTRVIPPSAKAKLGAYYSESEFDLSTYLQGKKDVYELGRTCVGKAYRGSKALSVLWLGMADELIIQRKAKYIIGCVSVQIDPAQHKILACERYLSKKAKTDRITSLNPLAISQFAKHTFINKGYKNKVPALLKKYKRIGGTFSKQGYYDKMFNCVDYFAAIKVNASLSMKLSLVCQYMKIKRKLQGNAQ